MRIGRLVISAWRVRIAGFGATPANHLYQVFWQATFLEYTNRNDTSRIAQAAARPMQRSVGHHDGKPHFSKVENFLFELHHGDYNLVPSAMQ